LTDPSASIPKLPAPSARLGKSCCAWVDFYESFLPQYRLWMDVMPTREAWLAAIRDWKSSNTGWEAAHNARARAREKVERENSTPLVWLGGKNYAEEGSALAKKYGKPATD
jgi:hypothetical protein